MSFTSINKCVVCGSKEFVEHLSAADHLTHHGTYPIIKCNACGFAFTQDAPDEVSMKDFYASDAYIPHSNTKKGIVNRIYHVVRTIMLDRKVRLVTDLVGGDNKRLLDIGCGTGYFQKAINDLGWKTIGIEQDEHTAEFARRELGQVVYSPDVLYTSGALEQNDVITLWHVLEHLHRIDEVMDRVCELLKTEGRLIIAIPNIASFDARYYGSDWAAYDVPRHLWHFSPKTFSRYANDKGFEILTIYPMPFDAFYIAMLSERARGRSFAFFRGLWLGGRAFVASLFDVKESSSLIYVLEKKVVFPE